MKKFQQGAGVQEALSADTKAFLQADLYLTGQLSSQVGLTDQTGEGNPFFSNAAKC